MEKTRVYELAKDLNTTSKRLMEKLAEVNIHVKNHMSLLEEHELKALYNHIGVIKHDDGKKADVEEKKTSVSTPVKAEAKGDARKDGKQAPRIIRTTEIFVDSKDNTADNREVRTEQPKSVNRDNKGDNRNRNNFVRTSSDNTGLRPGFVRDVGHDYKKDLKPAGKADERVSDGKISTSRDELRKESKPDTVLEAKSSKQNVENTDVKDKEMVKNMNENAAAIVDGVTVQNEKSRDAEPVNVEVQSKPEKPTDNSVAVEGQSRPDNAGPQSNLRGDRPQYDNRRGPGDRPQYDNRGQGDRHQYNNRGPGDRPQYDNRGPGDRPQYNNRGPGDRPQYDNRGQGDRPQYNNNRGPGDRPQYNNNRGPGDRPQYNNNRGPGDRPQYNNNRGPGDRPQYDNRGQGGFRNAAKPLEIPKPEFTDAIKDEANSKLNELRREFQNKDVDKDVKREQKKEIPKGQIAERTKRAKPQKIILEKKGVSEVLSEDYILDEFYSDSEVKKTKKAAKPKRESRIIESKHVPHRAVLTSIKIHETITVKDLAEALKKTSTEIIKKLMAMGIMATLNQELDFDTASIIADEFGVKTEKEVVVNEEDILFDDNEDNEEELQPRPPVVVVMGHVDHGKTSLLDAIKETNVMDTEAGGITQHIGAYMVKINNRSITFLDTPGHAAFTAMRARGAQVTDIAILVVAADDGVMPQTIEAINHAKAANVAIIVAINKIDKPGANPEKVKQELTEYGLVAEEWGGDTINVLVSAKNRVNIDQLLEMVLLTADMQELKANPNRQAKGTIIEAQLDKNRGPIATMLVQRGTLNIGDSIVTGTTVGRIRAMVDDKGHEIKKAGPSMPVEILGLPEVPEAGEIFYAITDEKVAKQLAEKRKLKQREQQLKASAKVSLDDLYAQIKEGKVKDLNIIVKADVQGSVEAVKQSLEKLSNEEVRVRIIHDGVGAVTESDVSLAQVSNAIIIGFNVRPGTNVAAVAENAGVDIRLYRVIYNAIDDIQAAMKGMLEPTFKEVIQGHIEVRQIFKVSGVGTIGGGYVLDGKVLRNSDVRIVRGGIVVHEGKLASLKRFKDDVKDVSQGYECGFSIEKFNDIKEGDVVEAYVMEEVAR